MDPTYSAEADAYRDKIQAFLAEHLPADWSGLRGVPPDQREEFVAQWRQLLGEHQLIAPAWPIEYGGGGLSAIERVILHEEFAKAGVPAGGANDGFGIGMIGPTLMVMGSEEQKKLVIGGEACMWDEFVNSVNLTPRLWPRASAVAERLWSAKEVRNSLEAKHRIQEMECRLLQRGYPVEPINGPAFCGVDWNA